VLLMSDGRCKIDGLALTVGSSGPMKVKAMNISKKLTDIEYILRRRRVNVNACRSMVNGQWSMLVTV